MTSNSALVDVKHINPFVSATENVFLTMLQCELKRGEIYLKETFCPDHEVSGVIGLSGKAVGAVILSLERNVAINATEAMLGERPRDLNPDVVDAIGELANMIAGNAKTELAQFAISLGLPNVIIGKNHTVTFPSKVVPIAIPFECKWGSICVSVGLCEIPDSETS